MAMLTESIQFQVDGDDDDCVLTRADSFGGGEATPAAEADADPFGNPNDFTTQWQWRQQRRPGVACGWPYTTTEADGSPNITSPTGISATPYSAFKTPALKLAGLTPMRLSAGKDAMLTPGSDGVSHASPPAAASPNAFGGGDSPTPFGSFGVEPAWGHASPGRDPLGSDPANRRSASLAPVLTTDSWALSPQVTLAHAFSPRVQKGESKRASDANEGSSENAHPNTLAALVAGHGSHDSASPAASVSSGGTPGYTDARRGLGKRSSAGLSAAAPIPPAPAPAATAPPRSPRVPLGTSLDTAPSTLSLGATAAARRVSEPPPRPACPPSPGAEQRRSTAPPTMAPSVTAAGKGASSPEPTYKRVWSAGEEQLAFLAYEASVRVCLTALLREQAPWAQSFLGDGDCLPLQRSFCIQSGILQRANGPIEQPASNWDNQVECSLVELHTPQPKAKRSAPQRGATASATGVERRIRVEVKSVVFDDKDKVKASPWKFPKFDPKQLKKRLSLGGGGGGNETGERAHDGVLPGCTPQALQAFNPFKKRRTDTGAVPSPEGSPAGGGEPGDLGADRQAAEGGADESKAQRSPQSPAKTFANGMCFPGGVAHALFSSPYDGLAPGGTKHAPSELHKRKELEDFEAAACTTQCKIFLARPEGQRVGESQFVTVNGAAHQTAAEFVRQDEGEVSLHLEMHNAGGKEKTVYSTKMPMGSLDGRKTVALYKDKKEAGKVELVIVEEDRVVSLADGDEAMEAETDDGQDTQQLLSVYDLVVKVALQGEGFAARALSLNGPWEALLRAFAAKHAVSESYCQLRYLLHVMDAAVCTPTADCFTIVRDTLKPLVQLQQAKQLPALETTMLVTVRKQVVDLLTYAFEHYKALSEAAPTGTAAPDAKPPLPAPALGIAVEVLQLLHTPSEKDRLKEYMLCHFKKAAQLIFRARQAEAEATSAERLLSMGGVFGGTSSWVGRARRLSERRESVPRDIDEDVDADKGLLQRGKGAAPGSSRTTPASSIESKRDSISDVGENLAAALGSTTVSQEKKAALADPVSLEHMRLVYLCRLLAHEVKTDIVIHDAVTSLQFVKMPCITSHEHCKQLRELVKAVLKSKPPTAPSPSVINLMYALDDLQRKLVQEWKIGGGLEKKLNVSDLFNDYMGTWLNRTRTALWNECHESMGIKHDGEHRNFSAGVHTLYRQMRLALTGAGTSYDRILQRWPTYLNQVEAAVCDVESKFMQLLLDDCGGTLKSGGQKGGGRMGKALAAKDKAMHIAGRQFNTMSTVLKNVTASAVKQSMKVATPSADKHTLHPALARASGMAASGAVLTPQRLQGRSNDAGASTPRGERGTPTGDTGVSSELGGRGSSAARGEEREITVEEVLLPIKWKIVLLTLRQMLDMRPEVEQIMQAYERKNGSNGSGVRGETVATAPAATPTIKSSVEGGRTSRNGGLTQEDVPFGKRFSTNTGGVRHHYMRHIKFVVENIHREVGRSKATSVSALLRDPDFSQSSPEEVAGPLKELLATIFATLRDALGDGHVVTSILKGIWDNLAFDVLCSLEEDENADWRKSLLVGELMVSLDTVFVAELHARSSAPLLEKDYPSHVKKVHNVLQTSKQAGDSFDMYS